MGTRIRVWVKMPYKDKTKRQECNKLAMRRSRAKKKASWEKSKAARKAKS